MNKINKIKAKRILIFSCLVALSISPLIPDGNIIIPRIDPLIQNLLHVPLFAILAILLFLIFSEYQFGLLKRMALVVLISLTVSILTESIQHFMPGRLPSYIDIGSNFIGMLSGIFFMFGMRIFRSIKSLY